MRSFIKMSVWAALALILMACETGPKSASGFRLPDGDIQKGKAVFLELKCHACHTVNGVDLPKTEGAAPVMVRLGGEVYKVRTYGELVTAIIHPSYELASGYNPELIQVNGQSRMPNYNTQMTVQQMIDLVAFLQSRYQLVSSLPPVY